MVKHKNKRPQNKAIQLTILGIVGLVLVITLLLQGTDVRLFSPKGLIASEQQRLMIVSIAIMLTIAIPTLAVLYFFAWKYRETNPKATYDARTPRSKWFVFSMWAVPTAYMLVLASIMWPASHRLAPQKSVAADNKPLVIQVIAMRWKWLFIYPEQNIATVNYVQIPVNTPVQFELTADETPMSSFWIPHLGGQLYAMTGHVNRLNLMAETPGDYPGSSAEINGAGFAGMKFTARVSSLQNFGLWVQEVKQSSATLDEVEYENLLKPSKSNPSALYAQTKADLYTTVLNKYVDSHNHLSEHEAEHQ